MIFGTWDSGTKNLVMRSLGAFGGFKRRDWQNEDVVARRREARVTFGPGEDVIV